MRLLLVVLLGCLTAPLMCPFSAAAFAPQSDAVAQGAPAPPAPPLRFGGNIRPPQRTKNVNPVYPAIAQSARVQGIVIIEATIGANGDVTNARVLRSIPLLDQAALDAVRQWQFSPTLVNGVPVAVIMTMTVQFSLPTDATPRPCTPEPTLKAPSGPTTTLLRFVNQSGEPRNLYRLDASGQRIWELTLGEAGTIEQPTQVDQAWVVTNARDECIAIYVAEPNRLNVTLRPVAGSAR
jgi:protein TonB